MKKILSLEQNLWEKIVIIAVEQWQKNDVSNECYNFTMSKISDCWCILPSFYGKSSHERVSWASALTP